MSNVSLNVISSNPKLVVDKASADFLVLHSDSGILQITSGRAALLIPSPQVKILSIVRQGPSGVPGSDKHYVHTQITSSASWVITHNLTKKPSVTIVDSGDNKVVGDVIYIDENSLTINFSAPFGGKCYLN